MPPVAPRIVIALVIAFVATAVVGVTYATRTHEFSWIDLEVYRWAGDDALHPSNLYATGHPTTGLPFTYTPFAALCFVALDAARLLTPIAWTVLSIAALLRMSWLLARERGAWMASMPPIWPTLTIASAVLISQPGSATVRLGQVGFLLPWLVCEDLLGRERRRRGALVGIATAIKLTPGAFLPFLAVAGRWRAFTVAVGVSLVATVVGWIALPQESRTYWRHLGPDVTTVGPVTTEDHWSVNATIWRVFGDGGNDVVWLALAVVAFGGSLLLARRWWAGEARAGAVGIVGLGAVLASPFSWSHHWVIVAPLFVGLLAAASRSRRRRTVYLLVLGCLALVTTSLWWHGPRAVLGPFLDPGHATDVAQNTYLVVAVMLLAMAWVLRPRVDSVTTGPQPPVTRRAGVVSSTSATSV